MGYFERTESNAFSLPNEDTLAKVLRSNTEHVISR